MIENDKEFLKKVEDMGCIIARARSLINIMYYLICQGLDDEIEFRDIVSICIIMQNEFKIISNDLEYLHIKLGI